MLLICFLMVHFLCDFLLSYVFGFILFLLLGEVLFSSVLKCQQYEYFYVNMLWHENQNESVFSLTTLSSFQFWSLFLLFSFRVNRKIIRWKSTKVKKGPCSMKIECSVGKWKTCFAWRIRSGECSRIGTDSWLYLSGKIIHIIFQKIPQNTFFHWKSGEKTFGYCYGKK